jgi:putative ABC transport system substrate-binding protein
MLAQIGRRRFLIVLGGSVAWSLRATAQQTAKPVIGFIGTSTPAERMHLMAAFRQGLAEMGFIESQNLAIEYHGIEGQYDGVHTLAADLVHRDVTVIAALGVTPAALAVKAATSTIPIVFLTAADPVRIGLVSSLSQPGGNVTGIAYFVGELGAKRLKLLHEVVPNAAVIAIIVNPTSPATEIQVRDIQAAARIMQLELVILGASTEREIDAAFATMIQEGAHALVVASDPFFFNRRDQVVALAARHAIPAIYTQREYAAAGGLISYATDVTYGYRQAGIYIGKILKGAKPADLPVLQASKYELVINLTTAKAIALQLPQALLALADELVE